MRKLSIDEVRILDKINNNYSGKIPVAVYARKSKQDQSGMSLETQIDSCSELIVSQKKYFTEIAIYKEENVSGRDIKGRKELLKLIEEIKNEMIKVVVISKWDRISRNTADLKYLKEKFAKYGTLIISLDDSGEISASANLQREILAVIDQYYLHRIAEDTKTVLINITKQGKSGGGIANFGYRFNKFNELVMEPIEAAIVQKIYNYYEISRSYNEVAIRLNRENFKTRKGNKFRASTIKDILTNVKYKGVYRYNREDRIQSNLPIKKFDEVWVEDGIKNPIISVEQFDRIQTIIRTTKKVVKNSNYNLTGIMICGECGAKMHGSARSNGKGRGRTQWYACPNRSLKNGGTCTNKGISHKDIENKAKDLAYKAITIYINNDYEISQINKVYEQKKQLIKSTKQSITNLKSKQNQQIELLLDDDISDFVKNKLNEDIESIENEIIELNNIVEEEEAAKNKLKDKSAFKNVDKNDLFNNNSNSKMLYRIVFKNIKIKNDEIIFEINKE